MNTPSTEAGPTIAPAPLPQTAPAMTLPGTPPPGEPAPPAAVPARPPNPGTQPLPPPRPASTYDPSPPYPVRLYVEHPEEEQPGWLRILALNKERVPASCHGIFPEQNVIRVDTDNVLRLRLHLGHLPLAAGRRTILQIDGQGIQLTVKGRRYIYLERRPTGGWTVTHSE